MPTPSKGEGTDRGHWAARPSGWLMLSLVVLCLDYLSGPIIQFPILMVIPVSLAAWHGGLKWGVGLSLGLGLARIGFSGVTNPPWSLDVTVLNAVIRALALVVMAFFAHVAAELTRELKDLRRLLPVCTYCKRIRQANGQWESLERSHPWHPGTEFADVVCPECAHEHYPALFPPPHK